MPHPFDDHCACPSCGMIRDVVNASPLLADATDAERQQMFESLRRTMLPGPAQIRQPGA
ncbi:hypothetical protein [Mycobacterium sp. E1715]|uniref:hypothetical protein n=1 Tax=Mycobacterium sp. E1715 TaxID=1856863 RepID=UPI0012EA4B55|nr:hypothetical protein [Mycobacterium sp. E1715]